MNVQIQPTQGMQSLAERSTVISWLNHLQVLMPPRRVMLVGAGNASGRWVQWLQQANIEAASLFEAADDAFHSLQALVSTKPNWRASQQVIGPNTQIVTFYVASVGSESGLLEPESQQGIWPNIKTRQKQDRQAITLSEAMRDDEVTADCLVLDCSPALTLLMGAAELLSGVHVVLARTALSAAGEQGESQELAGLKQHLAAAGFRLVCTEAGRHPVLGHALWVRQTQSDSESLRPQLEAALKENAAQTVRHAEQLAQATAATKKLAQEHASSVAHAKAAQDQCEQLQAELLKLKETQIQQRRTTEEAKEAKEALEKTLAAAQAEKALLSKENAAQAARHAEQLAQAAAATKKQAEEHTSCKAQGTAAQAHAEQLQAEILKLKETQIQQRRTTEEAKEAKEALEKTLSAAQAEKALLSKEKAELVAAREKVEKLANERQARIKLLDQRLQILQTNMNNGESRYRALQAELLKAEAQIELIKAFVLRDPAQ
ncbi:hypothetical protein [Hydrogenophaga sp.]|uniref:hypothetical protein n=1 Tax=Hydrogenophaga sp. TaxID=1904254 RepID=UPI00272F3E89|nr:hypothetical protein [Hydrogenophaga sp.]MDP2073518.1 hypothetical protein [Hydrogenophaga sp.]MDP3109426.1 hypothetical protein [Hydrogenophaga sp.]